MIFLSTLKLALHVIAYFFSKRGFPALFNAKLGIKLIIQVWKLTLINLYDLDRKLNRLSLQFFRAIILRKDRIKGLLFTRTETHNTLIEIFDHLSLT